MLALGIAAHSQAFKASYTYDDNGNRTLATIIWLSTSLKSDMLTAEEVEQLQTTAKTTDTTIVPQQGYAKQGIDSLAGTKITLYPNPTHGIVLVQLNGFDAVSNKKSIAVYDITGSKILQLASLSEMTSINLQSQPAGTYIMVIQIGAISKTYSIIKN